MRLHVRMHARARSPARAHLYVKMEISWGNEGDQCETIGDDVVMTGVSNNSQGLRGHGTAFEIWQTLREPNYDSCV